MLEVNVKFLFLVNALFKVFVQSSEVPRTSVVFLDSFFKLETVLNGIIKCFDNDSPSVEKMIRICIILIDLINYLRRCSKVIKGDSYSHIILNLRQKLRLKFDFKDLTLRVDMTMNVKNKF